MATKTRNVRYPDWLQNAVKVFAEKNGFKDNTSQALIFLLECELNRRGFFRTDYEFGITDQPLSNDIQGTEESDRNKKLQLENNRLKRQMERLNSEKIEVSALKTSVLDDETMKNLEEKKAKEA